MAEWDKEFADELETVSSPGMAFPDVIFEQAANGYYIVWDRLQKCFRVNPNGPWSHFDYNGVRYIPLQRLPWLSVNIPKEYESEEQLFQEVREFFVKHLDVRNPLLYDVYAAFVLASWRPEDFTVVPYLFFLGPLASGKTRALECFHRLCYRAIMATSMSAAACFRALEAWHPTLLLDETEVYNRAEMVEVLALLNSGYRRGQYAIRIEKIAESIPQIAMFDVFGFKVLAGTSELAATLQSRCILTNMSRAVRDVELFVDEAKAEELRAKLLMYRFRNLGAGVLDISKLVELNGFYRNSRVIELFVSLLHVAPESVKPRLVECMHQIMKSRLEEEQASLEGRILDAVLKCEDRLEGGKFSVMMVTEIFNEGLPEKERLSSRTIGRKLRSMGFQPCRLTGGPAGYYWDSDLIERLKRRYRPELTSLSSLSSLSSLGMLEKLPKPAQTSEESEETASQQSSEFNVGRSIISEESEESEVSEESSGRYRLGIVKLERLTLNVQGKCVECGVSGRMDFQITLADGSWGLLCDNCGYKIMRQIEKGEL